MHQMMLDLMVKMMPFMMPLVYAGGALLAVAVLALVVQLAFGRGGGVARACGWLLVILGVFFLACQGAGMILGAAPSINFADSTKGDFDLKPFWEIGLGMLIPGLIVAAIAKMARNLKGHGLDEGISTRLLVYAGQLIAKGVEPVAACSMTLVRPLTDDPDMRETLDAAVATFFVQ